jgi:hypothetical protein
LPAPRLDDRTYQQILDEAIRRIPDLCPRWTDWNPSDPGITLLELMAWMSEMLLYRINRIPESCLIRFLDLMGVELREPTPASAWVVFTGDPACVADLVVRNISVIPIGTRLSTISGNAPASDVADGAADIPVAFSLMKAVNLTQARLVDVVAAGARIGDRLPARNGEPILGEGRHTHVLFLGDARLAACSPGMLVRISFDIAEPMSGPLQIEWEMWDGSAWIPLLPSKDATVGLRQSGTTHFTADCPFVNAELIEVASPWIRMRLIGAIGDDDTTHRLQVPGLRDILLTIEQPAGLAVPLSHIWVSLKPAKKKDAPTDTSVETVPYRNVEVGADFMPFGPTPQTGDTMYMASPVMAETGRVIIVHVQLAEGHRPATNPPEDLKFQWEYFSRKGAWQRLGIGSPAGTRDAAHAFEDDSRAFTRSGTVSFRRPDDMAATTTFGEPEWTIRCRLTGEYRGEDPIGVPLCRPLGIRFVDGPSRFQHVVAVNGDMSMPLGDSLEGGKIVSPFRLDEGRHPVLHLALDAPIGEGKRTILFLFEEGEDTAPQPLAWEYSAGDGFRPLALCNDATRALTCSGTIDFYGPSDWASETIQGLTGYWLRARLLAGSYAPPPRLLGVHLNAGRAVQVRQVRNEILGTSTGAADQVFSFRHKPVLAGRAGGDDERWGPVPPCIEVREPGLDGDRWLAWLPVDNFLHSTSGDRHCKLDLRLGTVAFGDGRRGMIPPMLLDNIQAAYSSGGGRAGNVATGGICIVEQGPAGIGVKNVTPAAGGADAGSLEDALAEGPWRLKHRDRAVTCEDYERLARAASSEVAKAFCFAEPGGVHLLIVPRDERPRPRPTGALARLLAAHLDARRIVTTRLRITGPIYEDIELRAELALEPAHAAYFAAVRERCVNVLHQLVHPLSGGHDGRGWPLGRALHVSDLYGLLTGLPQIDHVSAVRLRKAGESRWRETIPVNERGYPAFASRPDMIVQV